MDNPSKTKHRLNRIPADFMTSERSRQSIGNIIFSIETVRENQEYIDNVYDN